MKKIDKLILYPFCKLFILALVSTCFVIVLQIFIVFLNDFIGKGLGASNYALLASYISLSALPHALPLAIIFACIVSLGGLSENLEITALKAAGISFYRIIKSLLVVGIAISFCMYFVNTYFVPRAAIKCFTLLYDMRSKKPDVSIKEGLFYDGIPGYSIRIGRKDKESGTIHDVMIYDHTRKDMLPSLTVAKDGRIYMQEDGKELVIELQNGHSYMDLKDSNSDIYADAIPNFVRANFKMGRIIIGLESLQFSRTKEELFERNRRAKNRDRLKHDIEEMRTSQGEIRGYLEKNFKAHFYLSEGEVGVSDFNSKKFSNADIANAQYVKELLVSYKGNLSYFNNNTPDAVQIGKDALVSAQNFRNYIQKCAQHDYSIMVDKNSHEIDLYKMFTWAISCFTVMLLGISLGSLIKKGGLGVPLLISGILIVIHYVIEIVTEKWAKYGLISTLHSAWATNYVMIPLGIFLFFLAYRDIKILDYDLYSVFVKRLRRKLGGGLE